jgi:hypothetical protein
VEPEPFRFALRMAAFLAALTLVIAVANEGVRTAVVRRMQIVSDLSAPEIDGLIEARGRVLLLGDSVMGAVSVDDQDKTTLASAIIGASSVPVVDESRGGCGIEMESAEVIGLRTFGLRPRAVILEVNPRHFSPGWELDPYLQQPEVVWTLETGWILPVRAAAVFKYRFGVLSDRQFLATKVRIAGHELGRIGGLDLLPDWFPPNRVGPAELARTSSLVRYATDIERSRSLRTLRSAVATLRKLRIPAVVFVTPIDVDSVHARLDPREFACVERNLGILRATIAQAGIHWADLSRELHSEAFDHPASAPNEHLRAAGRKFVADKVSLLLAEALND